MWLQEESPSYWDSRASPKYYCNRVNLLPTLRFHGNDFVVQLTTKDIWIFIVQMKTSGTCFMQGSRSVQLPIYCCKSSNVFNSLTNLVSPRNLWEETAATDIPTCSCCGTPFIWSLHRRVRTLFLSIRVPLKNPHKEWTQVPFASLNNPPTNDTEFE
jgi:hypothetical protein